MCVCVFVQAVFTGKIKRQLFLIEQNSLLPSSMGRQNEAQYKSTRRGPSAGRAGPKSSKLSALSFVRTNCLCSHLGPIKTWITQKRMAHICTARSPRIEPMVHYFSIELKKAHIIARNPMGFLMFYVSGKKIILRDGKSDTLAIYAI